MPTIPPNLGDLPDEDLLEWQRQLVQLMSQSATINDVMANAPRVAVVQAEIQRRATGRLHEETSELREAIRAFDQSSKAAADKIRRLTLALVVLTTALVAATIALIVATLW